MRICKKHANRIFSAAAAVALSLILASPCYAAYDEDFDTFGAFLSTHALPIIVIGILILACLALIFVIFTIRRRNEIKLKTKNVELMDAYEHTMSALQAKGDFLSRMSNEIRMPMNNIISLTNQAEDEVDDQVAMAQFLSKMQSSSEVLMGIINDVLDMSSIESGKLEIRNQKFKISQLISSVTSMYYTRCDAKGLVFSSKIVNLLEEQIVGDSVRLNQILMNLLSNAVKFTERGYIYLSVEQSIVSEETLMLHFTVSDTGCGMSPSKLKDLWKPFQPDDAAIEKGQNSSGLGLAIVKNLVTLMGGKIEVQSQIGDGSSFYVDIPFERCEQTKLQPSKAMSAMRLLVVDEERSDLEYIKAVLTSMNVKYETASSTREALDMLERARRNSTPYNVCLVDWKKPMLHGLEISKALQTEVENDELRLITSAYDLSIVSEQADDIHYDRFLQMPIFASTICETLSSLPAFTKKALSAGEGPFVHIGKRMLLLEDNRLNCIVIEGYLQKTGIVVERAEDGREALDKFRYSKPGYYNVMLIDMEMPVMDGLEVTEQIRASSHTDARVMPIIALTVDDSRENITRFMRSGMDDYIMKPIETNILLDTLERVLTRDDGMFEKMVL